MKKVKKIFLCLLPLLMVVIWGVNYVFYEPTKINSVIAAKLYKAPANMYFTDDNLYKFVVDAYNEQNGTSVPYTANLTDEQLKTITSLTIDCDIVYDEFDDNYCSEDTIVKNLSGLEKLTSLDELSVFYLDLETIDISAFTYLTKLIVNNTNISSIDVSKNQELTFLYLNKNHISDLDVSKNVKLVELHASFNDLSNIDLKNNLDLQTLDISNNENLSTLDVSNNTKLGSLEMYGTKIDSIDLSKNTELYFLYLGDKSSHGMECTSNKNCYVPSYKSHITSIDLSNNKKLYYLYIGEAPISSLDLSNNTSLDILEVFSPNLTSLDVSNNNMLSTLNISDSGVIDLNLGNINLDSLNISGTKLTSLNLNENQYQITTLDISDTLIKNIDFTNLIYLSRLYADRTSLTELDLSKNVELISLSVRNELYFPDESTIDNTKISDINLENNIALKYLDIGNIDIDYLDLSKNINLERLMISGTNLKTLDLSKNIKLEYLDISDAFDNYKCVYKGNGIKVNNPVILSDSFDVTDIIWTSVDESVALVSTSGDVNTIEGGYSIIDGVVKKYNSYYDDYEEFYSVANPVDVVEITSDVYTIDEENSFIVVTDNDAETIINNINGYIPDDVTLDVDMNNKKLYVKYQDEVLKTFDIEYNAVEVEKVQYFEDENLYKCVIDAYNRENDSEYDYDYLLSDIELANIKDLNCSYQELGSTKGIEKLTSLTNLNLTETTITDIDLSKNINLIHLSLDYNHLNALDVSKNTKLVTLNVSANELSELNLNNNTNLVYLYAGGNKFSTLDLSKNTKLMVLSLGSEHSEYDLNILQLSYNPCGGGMGFGPDDPSSPNLIELNLENNVNLEYLYISGISMTSIDLSKNTKLEVLFANNSKLTSLDVSKNTYLRGIYISDSQIANLVLGDAPLEYLYASNTKLTSLDFNDAQSDLSELMLNDNSLTSVDLSKLSKLSELQVYGVDMNIINLEEKTELEYLYIGGPQLTSLSLDNNKKLKKLVIEDSLMTELDLTNVENINALVVKNTPLDNLVLGNISLMNYIDLTGTKLVGLDLSDFSKGAEDIGECYYINLVNNTFGKKLYTYKGNETTVSSEVKFPEFYNPTITWSSDNESKATVNQDGVVKTNDVGVANIVGKINKCEYDWDKEEDVCHDSVLTTSVINVVEITSDVYTIDEGDATIYINSNSTIDSVKENISVSNNEVTMNVDINNNKLVLKYGNDMLKEYTLIKVNLDENITTDENIELDESIVVDETRKYFSNIDLNTNVNDMLDKISTDKEVIITNNNNEVLSEDALIGTGSKVIVKSDDVVYEYTIVIAGDTTGDGKANVTDVSKLYQSLRNKIQIEDYFEKAGNVVGTDDEIKITDVTKLYQFVKKKIGSLEG